MTLSYFYPRNEIMFGPGVHSNNELRDAWSGWATMNHVRSVLILAAALSEMAALSVFERVSAE